VWLQIVIVAAFSAGMIVGVYFLINDVVIPRILASDSTWTQTDWVGGDNPSVVTGTTTTWTSLDSIEATASAGQLSLTQASGWSNDYLAWTKRAEVTITNSGVEQTDYQVKLTVTYDGDMQVDFDDLRFTNSSGTPLDYWLERKTDSTSATVWVEIDSLAASGDTTIYMYYGNAGVSTASSGDNTFLFFDDFSGGSLDTNKWNVRLPQYFTIVSGELQAGEGGSGWNKDIAAKTTFDRADLSFEMKYRWTSSNASYDALMFGWKDNDGTWNSSNYYNLIYGYYDSGNGTCTVSCPVYVYEDGTGRGTVGGSWTVGQQYVTRVRMKEAGGAYYEQSTDGGVNWTLSYNTSYSTESSVHPAVTLYSGVHMFDDMRVRKWMTSEPTSVFASEEAQYPAIGTLDSVILDGGDGGSYWEQLTYSTSETANLEVKVRTQDDTDFSDAPVWSSCTAIASGEDMASTDTTCVNDSDRYIQYHLELTPNGTTSPVFTDITLNYSSYDTTAPSDPADILMYIDSSLTREISGTGQPNWNSATNPYFTWTESTDTGGSNLKGYCIYLGTDVGGDPEQSKGVNLGTSPVTLGNKCQFIVPANSLNLATAGYLPTALTTNTTYYLNVMAIDNADNISSSQTSFSFQQDSTNPTNVSYISAPTGTVSNVTDFTFNWPAVTGAAPGAIDDQSGILGYQYQINSTEGTWKGTETDSTCNTDIIPVGTTAHTLSTLLDGGDVVVGSNVIYFQAIDSSCRVASAPRTANLSYGGDAPSFENSCDSTVGVTVDPTTATSNLFTLSWDAASPADGQTITNYYYMVNTSPPASYATITSNTTTYLDNGVGTSVPEGILTGAVKGTNTVYVVAVDDAENYSSSNCLKGTFTLNSTLPDPPANLSISDSSIKASSIWRASLAWSEPTYTGTGALTYKIQRSLDNSTWTNVATTTGTAYVDTVATSQLYYWRVASYDTSAQSIASPTYATAVSLTPKGSYAEAPSLASEPAATAITTKKATITWSTSRVSDSKVQYGTTANAYLDEEPSNSTQVTSHSINLSGLSAGTTYYYRSKWTDEDGNTGVSDEDTFTTDAAPVVTEPAVGSISLNSAIVEYTVSGASKIKIYYGKTTAFGGTLEVTTASSETTYTTQLTGLEDGTKYYYKINAFDSEDVEYEGNVLSFETLPRPKIATVRLQQVRGSSSSTVLVTWTSNTEISSIVTYYPSANSSAAQDKVEVKLTKSHTALIPGLLPNTAYTLIVKGRDRVGNEALSDPQTFTTATDTRPPTLANLKVDPVIQGAGQEATAQLVISWDTDELATSQVAYGEGTTGTLSTKTQRDVNLTYNHLVVVPNLQPSKVYHVKALSQDDASNEAESVDRVVITPKAAESALNLVVSNLSKAFGFLGNLQQN